MGDYDKGYRAGVMAERRRAMLIALRAITNRGGPSEEGHSLAHQIGMAKDQIPAPVPEEPEEWSVFGERRMVRELPTLLESTRSPFTAAGIRYISRLEDKYYSGDAPDDRSLEESDHQVRIDYLEEQLADAPGRVVELEKMVETLSLQLSGVIS